MELKDDTDEFSHSPNPALYPTLPTAPEMVQKGHLVGSHTRLVPAPASVYRLQKISELEKFLEGERDARCVMYKKYKRGLNVTDGLDTAMACASLGLGASGIGLLTTVIAAPVVIGLEAAAGVCALVGIAGKFIGRKLWVKAEKHSQIRMLAESKLNSVSDHISMALRDGVCDENEYRLILDEVDKYRKMKTEIKKGAKIAHAATIIDEETKKSLINQGRKEARESIRRRVLDSGLDLGLK